MDLAVYAQIVWKHKRIVVAGVALGVVLAVFSYYRVEAGVPPQLTPRKAEVWQSSASVLLTQGKQVVPVPGVSDPGRLSALAGLYARLAMSDEVLRRMAQAGGAVGSFEAVPSFDRDSDSILPVVVLFGKSSTPERAQAAVASGLAAFLSYVRDEQKTVRERNRVKLRVLNSPQPAQLAVPRKKTLPIVVFLSILMAAIASAFILENRARSPLAEGVRPAPLDEPELRSRRTAEVELQPASERTSDGHGDHPAELDQPAAPARRWA